MVKNTTSKQLKVYVASSWGNSDQQTVVKKLKEAGFDVYDFRSPSFDGKGFEWSQVWERFDHGWQDATFDEFLTALEDPVAEKGYTADIEAINSSDACVMVLPCANSSHSEFGYFAGAKKPTVIYIPNRFKVELMYKMASLITNSIDDVVEYLLEHKHKKQKTADILERWRSAPNKSVNFNRFGNDV